MPAIADIPSRPHVKRWTEQEYRDYIQRGFINENETILLDGQLLQKSDGEPIPKLWSKAEYNEKVELGFLTKRRVHLYKGELIEVPTMGYLHAQACKNLNYWMFDHFDESCHVIRIRSPLEIPGESMPEPDAALVTAEQLKHFPHPDAAVLVVEISEPSLEEIEREKANGYASAQVPEYWIVSVGERAIEINRDPVVDQTSVTGFRYASHRRVDESEVISPLVKPSAMLRIADLVKVGS